MSGYSNHHPSLLQPAPSSHGQTCETVLVAEGAPKAQNERGQIVAEDRDEMVTAIEMSQCFTSPKYWGYFISNRYLKVM